MFYLTIGFIITTKTDDYSTIFTKYRIIPIQKLYTYVIYICI